ncbi:MAG TPA: hypothetical protein VL947_07565 [Cytophagales bacterium]|nr:hypothetical protein [Cytophagales bacterium]
MISKRRKKMIISLIMNDLIYGKLMLGLHRLHISIHPYQLTLSELIFKLMGTPKKMRTSKVYDTYSKLCLKALDARLDVRNLTALNKAANQIYDALVEITG